MILYKKDRFFSLPKYLLWMDIWQLLFILMPIAVALIIFGFDAGVFSFVWLILSLGPYLFRIRRPRACQIALQNDVITITCSKWFAVYDVTINLQHLGVELYKNKYWRYNSNEYQNYLYFTDTTDKNVFVEFTASFFSVGKVLEALSHQPIFNLGDKELNLVARYQKEIAEFNTPRARFFRILIPTLLIGALLLIFYIFRDH